MSFVSVPHSKGGYVPKPNMYPNGIYIRRTEDTNKIDFYRCQGDNPQTHSGHGHMTQANEHPFPNDSAQLPPQCLYQHPVASHSLYPLYQPWQTSLLSGSPEKSLNDEKSVTNYGRDDFSSPYAHEKPVKPTYLEPKVSPLDACINPGSHPTSTSGSLYMSDTASPSSSHSSSGYGSSSGSTSSSPYPSPSLPDPAATEQIDAGPTANPTVPPIEDGLTVKPKKARTSYSTEQISTLETAFKENAYPDYDKLEELAKTLGVTERKIKVWFQNKRARWRKKHAAEPVYNPDMYSAPTAVASKISTPTGLPFNTTSGYSAPTKPYPSHAKYSAPSHHSVPSQYQTSGPMPGLYASYTLGLYPNHASVPPIRRSNDSSDAVPTVPSYPQTMTSAAFPTSYLPSPVPDPSKQTSLYRPPARLYQCPPVFPLN